VPITGQMRDPNRKSNNKLNMKMKPGSFLPAIVVLIASVASAGADTRNYSWNGSSMTPPSLYSGTTLFTEMANNRFHVTSPGGGWNGNQFGWDVDLADNEKVSGSMTVRVNDFDNGGSGLGRVRLLWFNAKFANGLNAFVGLYGSDKRTTRSEGWYSGGHPDWNKWEYNGNTVGAAAPAGKVYLFNSFNMNDPATNEDFFRAVDKSADHVLSWSAEYEAATDTVKVTTALDDVPWTVTFVGRQFNNLGWDENALPKQHGGDGGPGAWDAEYTQINWATTTVPAPASDTKNYSWHGLSGKVPTLYSGGSLDVMTNGWNLGRFHVISSGGGWNGNQFGWVGSLANNEKVSGSMTIRVNDFNNGGSGLGRVRLLWFNATFTNGLNAFVGLYASDKRTTRSEGWYSGGHPDWNKWEYNGNTVGAAAPAGKVYLFNSFNMNDPATNEDFFRAVDKSTDHVLSWSAQYIASDVVRVTTALDGVPWTTTDVNRQFNNLGWDENALPKQHGGDGGPGAWDAEYTQVNWATTPDAIPSIAITPTGGINAVVTWPLGNLYNATEVNGPWTLVPGTSPKAITMSPPAVAPIRFFKAQY